MSISSDIQIFYPTYDADKLAYWVAYVKGLVNSFINQAEYVEAVDVDLDNFVVRKAMTLIGRESESGFGIKSRSIEGFSESFAEPEVELFSHEDKAFLASKYKFHSDYTEDAD